MEAVIVRSLRGTVSVIAHNCVNDGSLWIADTQHDRHLRPPLGRCGRGASLFKKCHITIYLIPPKLFPVLLYLAYLACLAL